MRMLVGMGATMMGLATGCDKAFQIWNPGYAIQSDGDTKFRGEKFTIEAVLPDDATTCATTRVQCREIKIRLDNNKIMCKGPHAISTGGNYESTIKWEDVDWKRVQINQHG